MPRSLASKLRVYAAMVDKLAKLDDYLEVYAVFDWRDDIHEDMRAGKVLDPESAKVLEGSDQRLIEQRGRLLQRFPDVFDVDRKARIPREYWWWHLDEGPQVRREALAASERT